MKRYAAGLGFLAALPVVAMVAVGMPSCSSSSSLAGPAQSCSINSDCDSPLICVFTRCHVQCASAVDCASGERCVPSGSDAGDVNVCQLSSEDTCSAGSTCVGGEICGADSQCRTPCQTTANCLAGQTCVVSGGSGACYDPHDPTDLSVLQGGDAGSESGAPDATSDGTGTSESPDGALVDAPPADAVADASFVANPDATLGFTIPNVGAMEPSTGDGGSGDVMVTQSGNDSALLPAPTTIMTTGGNSAALYTFDSLTVVQSGSLRFTGTLPIIVVVRTSVNIQGQILVNGSVQIGAAGPGGFYGTNGGPGIGQPGASAGFPNSGSGGGSYCGVGGSGGASSPPAAGGGATYGTPSLVPLIGGSAGGTWENIQSSGPGGGAIEIVAGQQITIGEFGAIHAGGGAGGGYDYGGGAGSGGAILLEAPVVTVNGTLAANGGGGAQTEGVGASGGGADSTPNAQAAPGFGGFGGAGSAGTVVNGGNGLAPDAGTGFGTGGGGAGRIRINTANGAATVGSTAVISPAMSPATSCATQGTLN